MVMEIILFFIFVICIILIAYSIALVDNNKKTGFLNLIIKYSLKLFEVLISVFSIIYFDLVNKLIEMFKTWNFRSINNKIFIIELFIIIIIFLCIIFKKYNRTKLLQEKFSMLLFIVIAAIIYFPIIDFLSGNIQQKQVVSQSELYPRIKFIKPQNPDYNLKMAIESYKKNDYNNAIKFCKKALKESIKKTSEFSTETADIRTNLGAIYNYKFKYDKALSQLKKAKKSYNMNNIYDERLAFCYSYIGDACSSLDLYYDDALSNYKKALEIQKKILGENHPDTAFTNSNIGKTYCLLGQYEKALQYGNKALEIQKDRKDVNSSIIYNIIGNIHYSIGDYKNALEYNYKALKIQKEILGGEHSNTSITYNNIGNIYCFLEDYEKALEYNNKALGIQKKILGKQHPNTAISYNNIGWIFALSKIYKKEIGDLNVAEAKYFTEASKYFERAYEITRVLDVFDINNTICYVDYMTFKGGDVDDDLWEVKEKYFLESFLEDLVWAYNNYDSYFQEDHPRIVQLKKAMRFLYNSYDNNNDFEQWLKEKLYYLNVIRYKDIDTK